MTNDNGSEPHDQETPVLHTTEQVAVYLQVSCRSVERLIKSGLLPVIRISPRKRRVSQSDLDDFINRMRQHNS